MKLNWNFLGGGGGDVKQKTFCGRSVDIFWNCMFIMNFCLGIIEITKKLGIIKSR